MQEVKRLNEEKYRPIRALLVKLAIDSVIHKHLMEALLKSYREVRGLVKEIETYKYIGPEEFVILKGFGEVIFPMPQDPRKKMGIDELVDEYLTEALEAPPLSEEYTTALEMIAQIHLESEKKMKEIYASLAKKELHPIFRDILSCIEKDEEQHYRILKKLTEISKKEE